MIRTLQRKEPGLAWMMLCSTVFHLAFYVLLVTFHFSAFSYKEEPVYYVDIVNLPVAHPRAGVPSPGPAPASPPHSKQDMTLAEKTPSKTGPDAAKAALEKESEEMFQKRLAKVKKQAEAKEFTNALASLSKRVDNGGQQGQKGIPGGKGSEAGSDYAGYIRSRLTDAFKTTIAYQGKKPFAMVRITIDRNGRLINLHFEEKSNDKLFNDSVQRAIHMAEQTFPPPPDGERFEHSYRFAPEGVGKN